MSGGMSGGVAGGKAGLGPGLGPGRLSTGSPELDAVLDGGFPRNSINVLMGAPGTGKTVLAQQMVFREATAERPALYLTTLSEPMAKVVTYLQRFEFYDESRLLDAVRYEDVGPALLEHGAGHLVTLVKERILGVGPGLLVIDSFKALRDLTTSPLELRRLVAELGGLLSAYEITTFLVGEYMAEDVTTHPEFAVADGILELTRLTSAKRDERHLRVRKLRGSGYRQGMHAFSLGSDGIRVYPRLVTPTVPVDYTARVERVPTGVQGLDRMLGGGFWRGSSAVVVGASGSGKTTLGLAFALEGARQGEPSLYVNFQENPTQLARTIRGLGIDLEAGRPEGLHLMYRSPVEMMIDAVVVDVFRAIHERGIRRVVVDSLGELAIASSSTERFHDYMYALSQHFAVNGITSVLTLEDGVGGGGAQHRADARFSTLSDTLIELSVDLARDPPGRRLEVVKARGTHHPLGRVPMRIEAGGMAVDPVPGDG